MVNSKMLTYQEELELSDTLVERRKVRDFLEQTADCPTPEQKETLRQGEQAAQHLVISYLPYIRSLAKRSYNRHAHSPGVQVEELVHEGVLAALQCTWSFNARGSGDRPGVRFATYSGMAIKKAVDRHIAKMSTPVRVDVSIIQASWVWISAKNELREQLGREPSNNEVEEHTSISSNYVMTQIPHRNSFVNINEPEEQDVPGAPQVARHIEEDERNTMILQNALYEIFDPYYTEILMSYLGVDRHYPRMVGEVAEQMELSERMARKYIDLLSDAMCHPSYRVALYHALQKISPLIATTE